MPFLEAFFSIELHFELLPDNQRIWEHQMILLLPDAITYLPETINLCHWRGRKANKQKKTDEKMSKLLSLFTQWHELRENLSIWLHKIRLVESRATCTGNVGLTKCFGRCSWKLYVCLVQHWNQCFVLHLGHFSECLTSLHNNLKASALGDNWIRDGEVMLGIISSHAAFRAAYGLCSDLI